MKSPYDRLSAAVTSTAQSVPAQQIKPRALSRWIVTLIGWIMLAGTPLVGAIAMMMFAAQHRLMNLSGSITRVIAVGMFMGGVLLMLASIDRRLQTLTRSED